jgi:alpha,alpha-trehalase
VRRNAALVGMIVPLLAAAAVCALETSAPLPPSQRFGELFGRVQTEALFADSKTFADALPRHPPDEILAAYREERPRDRAALRAFIDANFRLPADIAVPAAPPASRTLRAHIAALWPSLIRAPLEPAPYGSQLGFAYRHVVPGGRFREIYYWDSYFTSLGLVRDGHAEVAADMVAGFADLITRYGFVPNGTRSYYLSRSQPPFFYLMVGLLAPDDPADAYARYVDALRAEHAFWMRGRATLEAGRAAAHVVMLADGNVLNRYWDAREVPRDESYREDVALAARADRNAADVYRDLRAAAESGWDFSSRWLADGRSLETIETTAIVPVDLNSLLYGLERAIAQACMQLRDQACADDYSDHAQQRRAAMDRYLWDEKAGHYVDYHWQRSASTGKLSAATLYPLFTGAASIAQAARVARVVRAQLLAPGGLATTMLRTGQQWDKPNGWAPLQWIAVEGLRRYGDDALAHTIAQRWLRTVEQSFAATGKLVEKYDVDDPGPGGGGEYPLQDGFGWTNGVTRALLDVVRARQ